MVCDQLSPVVPGHLPVIAHHQHHLIRHHTLLGQIQGQLIRHLPDDQAPLLIGIGPLQNLTGADAVGAGAVGLDIPDGAGLPAPGVVDEQLGIDPKNGIQQLLVVIILRPAQRAPGDISHGKEPVLFQLPGVPRPHPPEVRQRPVIPQLLPVALLRQLGDAHAVLIRRDMLGHNIHGHLAQIQIAADPGGGGDAGTAQHMLDHGHHQLPGGLAVEPEIGCQIHEHLIDGVDMDVLRGNILKVNAVNFGAGLHIVAHPGRGHDVGHRQLRVFFQLLGIPGLPLKVSAVESALPDGVDLPHPLHHLKESGPARNAQGLQGGRHRQADGFLRPALVRHHQIGAQRVQHPGGALHRGIEGF